MSPRKIELLLDDEDFDVIEAEITRRQVASRSIDPTGPTLLPEGESNLAGACLAESIRELVEWRERGRG